MFQVGRVMEDFSRTARRLRGFGWAVIAYRRLPGPDGRRFLGLRRGGRLDPEGRRRGAAAACGWFHYWAGREPAPRGSLAKAKPNWTSALCGGAAVHAEPGRKCAPYGLP